MQSEKDKREYKINITSQGIELLKGIDNEFKINKSNFSGLSVSEAFHLSALLDKLREY
jgi:hypothetical protein